MSPESDTPWPNVNVGESLAPRRGREVRKLKTEDYRLRGSLPIVDQGNSLICGYTDDQSAAYPYPLPVIIFGDHTRVLKFIDFPFAIGADGTQCISPKDGIDPSYFYYALSALDIRGDGYSRHFKALKEKRIPLPCIDEQHRIAAVLGSVDRCIRATADEIDQIARIRAALVVAKFSDLSAKNISDTRAREGWVRVRLREIFTERKERGITGLPVASISIDAGLTMRSALDRRVESTLSPEEHSLVRRGDIAYNTMRMWQGACGLAEGDCIVSPSYVVMTPSIDIVSRFALLALRAPPIVRLLHAYSQGIVDDRLRLYPDAFGQIPVNLPPEEWQQDTIEEFAAIDANLARARRTHDRLIAVRGKVLSDLLSGRVRVVS